MKARLQRVRLLERAETLERGDLGAGRVDRSAVTQERTALPSISTVQAPHCASPQPNLAPLSSRSLRST